MNMLSQKALDEFKKIYFEEFGKKLTDKETSDKASKFLLLMKLIYRPINKEVKREI